MHLKDKMATSAKYQDSEKHAFPVKGTLYAFIDEAGDFNLTARGSKYYILTCVLTSRPFACMRALDELKHDLIEQRFDIEYFHASNDSMRVRKMVFQILKKYEADFRMYYSAVNKQSLPAAMDPGSVYCSLFDSLSGIIELGEEFDSCDLAVAITDYLPNDVRKKGYSKRLKELLKNHVRGNFVVRSYHSMSDYGLQIADYYCWMVQRKLEMNDPLKCFDLPQSMRLGKVEGD